MYKRTSLSLSTDLQREMRGHRSLQTSWGMRAAFRFMAEVNLMPLQQWPQESGLATKHGPIMSHVFDHEFDRGWRLYNALNACSRLSWHLSLYRPNGDILTTLQGYRGNKKADVEMIAWFEPVLATMKWFQGKMRYHDETLQINPYRIDRCQYCDAVLIIEKPSGAEGFNSHLHHPACPHGQPGHMPSMSDWQAGYDLGIRMEDTSEPRSQNFQLGHDMGEVSYQALLACGRISQR